MVIPPSVGSRVEDNIGFMDFPRDVTAQTREAAYNAYNELSQASLRYLAMSFKDSEYVNSAVIGLVISLVEEALQSGCGVYCIGLSPHYQKLFGMVGLGDQMIFVDDDDALRAQIGANTA